MPILSAADGCRAGWVVVTQDLDTGAISWRLCAGAQALIHPDPLPAVLAIDIPIGLPDLGARQADPLARRLLGPGRGSSVFPAPLRPMLAAGTYLEACAIRLRIDGKKMSIQAWGIMPKIRDVDAVLSADPAARLRVYEIHPEVCFHFMAGAHPLRHGKKTPAGQAERLRLLEPHFGAAPAAALADRRALAAQPDDVLDAFAALWTARRIHAGTARGLPPDPPVDSNGLRMQIVY